MPKISPTPWVWPNSTLSRVIDGDTFVAVVTKDIGFGGSTSFLTRFRLTGINAPKLTTAAGMASRAVLAELLSGPFTLTSSKPYKYGGEWMATVTLADGRDASQDMIDAGHAVAWDGHGPRPGDDG